MNKEQFNQMTSEIHSKYQKLHKIIFTYGVFILIAIFSFIKLYTIFAGNPTEILNNDSLQSQKELKIKEFIAKTKLINQQQFLTGPIALGEFKETNEYIESFNNILYYKGFVIPRFFWISKTAQIQDIEYFNKGTYTIDEIDTLFKNVFIGSNKNTIQPSKNISFPLSKLIIDDFNLQCMSQSKISSIVCNIFINNFLNNFFIYNIDSDIDSFNSIMGSLLQDRKYNKEACQQILYYTYYTEKGSQTIENLLRQCEPVYQDKYRLFMDFIKVQKELFEKFISNEIYKDDLINIYKLISFQQIINDDINNKIINTDRIDGYFGFLQEVLKKDKIPMFYKELTYFFNNYYLKKAIENIEITSKMKNKADIDNISKQIIAINNGNPLIGFKGLKNNINQNIIEQDIVIKDGSGTNQSYEQKIDGLLGQIKDISIKQKFLSGNNLLIYGIRKLEIKSTNQEDPKFTNIAVKLRLEENNNTLIVKQVMLEEFESISQAINDLIKNQKWTFADLKKYIYQNNFLFTDTDTTNTDGVDTTTICKNLKDSLSSQEIKTCNNNEVKIDILWKNKVITMIVSHNNFILNNIDVSDSTAKTVLNEYLEDPEIINNINYDKVTKDNFVQFIKSTIDGFIAFAPKGSSDYEGSSNTIIIIDRVKKYLGIQINDIAEKNGKILIDFTVSGIPFLGYYNLEFNKISPIYFKEASLTGGPVLIKNLSLTLTDDNQSILNTFTMQPLEVIKQYSPEEYITYQKFISEKK